MPPETLPHALTETDRAWFADRVDELLPELYGRAVRLCREEADAEDLVAETVAKGWEALGSLEDRAAFRGWVFRILNNTFVSGCRSARSRAEHEPLDTTADDFSIFDRLHQPILLWWGSPETAFLNRLLREDLERAMDGLPEVYREVVVLVDVQGLAYREVAELLDVPVGTVRSRLARGRSRLQAALWQHGLEAGLTERTAGPENPEQSHDET
jgi:RNA polymerase sigma-70 factor, ECF subfamily